MQSEQVSQPTVLEAFLASRDETNPKVRGLSTELATARSRAGMRALVAAVSATGRRDAGTERRQTVREGRPADTPRAVGRVETRIGPAGWGSDDHRDRCPGPASVRASHSDIDGDTSVRDQLVIEHVGLVKAMASRLASRLPSQVELSDLVSVGMIGLIDAASRFKPSLGVPFSAFARRRIHGAMLDSLRALDWAPRAMRKLRRDVDSALANLRCSLGREPEAADMAQALGVSETEYERMLDTLKSSERAIICQHAVDEDGRTALDLAIEPSESQHDRLEREELRRVLAGAIGILPDREREVLALYYGKELTLAAIGALIGVGESRVSQLRSQAIARLRSTLMGSTGPQGRCPTRPRAPVAARFGHRAASR